MLPSLQCLKTTLPYFFSRLFIFLKQKGKSGPCNSILARSRNVTFTLHGSIMYTTWLSGD